MENNNLPVNEPVTEPVNEPVIEPVVSSPESEATLSQGTLSEPVLSGAATFATAETTSPETVEVKTEENIYVPPTVQLPTLVDAKLSGGSEIQTSPQDTYGSQQTIYNAQPVYGQQPIYVQQAPIAPQNNQRSRSSGFSVASLVLGIISVASCFGIVFGFVGSICGLLGIIFAICGFRKCRSGLNGAGLALSIVGFILSFFLSWACASACIDACSYANDSCYWYYDYDDGYYSDGNYNYYA